jgi:hypothetical protein
LLGRPAGVPALLLAVSEPLYAEDHRLALIIAAASDILGVVGALIGTFGLLYAKPKRLWLENRLRGEWRLSCSLRAGLIVANGSPWNH